MLVYVFSVSSQTKTRYDMNKKLLFSLCFGASTIVNAQLNKSAIDFNIGLTKPVYPISPGYKFRGANLFHFDLGYRRMLTDEFGVKLSYGYDRFKNSSKLASKEFLSYYNRYTVEGVVNLGRLLHFEQFAPKFSILAHAGFGLGFLRYSGSKWFHLPTSETDKTDHLIHGIFGLTPQYLISKKLAISADISILPSLRQSVAWDFNSAAPNDPGMDGNLANATIGISYYLGKNENSVDWDTTNVVSTKDDRVDSLIKRVEAIERRLLDDDNDGVPNLRDVEPGTQPNALVDSRGATLKPVAPAAEVKDKDIDGIPDQFDLCPDQKGPFAANGCPDSDGDGVPDNIDKCPSQAGERSNMGCPLQATVHVPQINDMLAKIEFDFNQATLKSSSNAALDKVADLLRQHSDYRLNLIGHTDDIGSDSYNVVLSIKRAEAVKKYLVGKGVSAAVLTATGLGETKPESSNKTSEGRAKNRRVEVIKK